MEENKERKPMNYWNNKERVLEEAKKYSRKSDFTKNSNGAYESALKNGWLEEATELMTTNRKPNGYWTKERCAEEASRYITKKEFYLGSPSVYAISRREKFIDDICSHMIPQGSLEKRHIYRATFPDGAIYIGLTCDYIRRFKDHLSDEISSIHRYMIETNTNPTIELVNTVLYSAVDASELETFIISEYKKYGEKVLNRDNGGGLGSNKIKWTYDKLKEESLKYSSKTEFLKNNAGAHATCVKRGILNELCSHMTDYIRPIRIWTDSKIREESLKYSTRADFQKGANYAYKMGLKNNILDELFPNKKPPIN